MINKNMIEKSIISLKTNIPKFVRNSYSSFIEIFKATIDVVDNISSSSPYTANKLAGEIIDGLPMLTVLKEVLSDKQFNDILINFKQLNIHIEQTVNPDERFSIINGTDIYAPLSHICACITPFSVKAVYDSILTSKIPIMYEVCKGQMPIGGLTDESYGFRPISVSDIEGFQGQSTVLDNLGTCLGIDIQHLFKRFFALISVEEQMSRSESKVELIKSVYGKINDDSANSAIEIVTKDLLATTIATFFVYATKLIGSKTDIFSWAYTAFVKDSMDNFDKTYYQNYANVTKASGHAVTGVSNDDCGGNDYTEIPISAKSSNDPKPDESSINKALIYRSIRLQYSTWATVINAIFTRIFRKKSNSDLFTDEYTRNIFKGKGFDHFAASSTEFKAMCDFIDEVLVQYAAAKYRTYNTTIQLCGKELKPTDSTSMLDASISYCRDESAVSITKQTIKGYKVDDIFISFNDKIAGMLTLNEGVKNALSKTFMDVAYLIILNYVHVTIGNVMEEIEPLTGKTNKQLFEEIYYGIRRSIYRDIANYRFDIKYKESEMIPTSILAYTPYCCEFDKDSVLKYLKPETDISPSTERDKTYNPYIEDIYVPFVSEYSKLKEIYDFGGSINSHVVPCDRHSQFPKNKIIIDGLTTLGHKLTCNRAFSSVENAKECIDMLNEIVLEGADAMANNACYSALASIGGGITEIEIKNEADKNFLSDSVAKLTDAEGNAIKQGTSDTEDLANLVSHAVESNSPNPLKTSENVVESYNELFNSVVLGIKSKK